MIANSESLLDDWNRDGSPIDDPSESTHGRWQIVWQTTQGYDARTLVNSRGARFVRYYDVPPQDRHTVQSEHVTRFGDDRPNAHFATEPITGRYKWLCLSEWDASTNTSKPATVVLQRISDNAEIATWQFGLDMSPLEAEKFHWQDGDIRYTFIYGPAGTVIGGYDLGPEQASSLRPDDWFLDLTPTERDYLRDGLALPHDIPVSDIPIEELKTILRPPSELPVSD